MRNFVKIGKYETRTAVYKMPAETARLMYKTRGQADKNTPFKRYLLNEINNEAGLMFHVSDVELV